MLLPLRAALGLLTRLPVQPAPLRPEGVWAFGLAGLAVGGLAAALYWLALAMGLPTGPAAALALAAQVLLTGGLHEDGLADCADGLWGGFERAGRLEIMRDSRVGSYGVLGIGLTLLLRWSALVVAGPLGLVAAAVLSRAAMIWPMHWLPHARKDGLARLAGRPSMRATGLAFGLATLLALPFAGWGLLVALPLAAMAALACSCIAKAKIGGQTGDVLGATQQMAEIVVLLGLAALV
ncbi:adenosylcobinamide-GDP ribazoletransferase [Limimaricola variabilis]|uniref:adenosylcobinamide-GDP ribazoletransferase n=1 Tax=Limimaricola variabilis TaxID=1492771 RepID=UPI002AC95525|nr:adenosylcobinamide-GDP ribazoletransferase [Limimaricola variabilis]WPY93071.1 adenosylcobinamide-GDP ribazoletransferase [Limimaricola variabilis]